MRVAIYYPWVYLKSGIERTLMEIMRRSRHDWTILTSHYDADGTYPDLKEMGVVELQRVSVKRRYGTVLRAAATITGTKIDMSQYDALFISCEGLGSLLNFRNHAKPVACLCFTPLRAVYDHVYRERHIEYHRAMLPAALLMEAVYKVIDRLAWRYYDRVFCISECVKRRVLEGRLARPDQIAVAFPGIDGGKIAPSDTFEPFFFLPGRIMWTKNIQLGIEAFQRLREQTGADFRLIIAGMVDGKSQSYYEYLQGLANDDPSIEFIVNPSEAEMQNLYRRCYTLLFTAFNEDLGLTPLEAMACGKPSIAVNRGGPLEIIVHDQTGLLIEPEPEAFHAAMAAMVADPARVRAMGKAGAAHAQNFTWDKFVAILDAYVDTLGAEARKGSNQQADE